RYKDIPDTHFFICAHHSLSGSIPRTTSFPALLGKMHKRGISPKGNSGFPLETFAGNSSQMFPVSDTWEECFSHGMQHVFANEVATNGLDEESEAMKKSIIPGVRYPLETGGRSITPRLVHGDLWDHGNASVNMATGKPLIF
ncbi:hypothetical protein DL98DRAFT_412890, partial [Cadophora sp. DSE1049]